MSNHEHKCETDFVHVLMALQRVKYEEKRNCIRVVIRDYKPDLESLEAKCKAIGGEWRIHHTVNARDTHKALRKLQHTLLDHPEKAGYLDIAWRTELLQPDCIHGTKLFMLDIDTKELPKMDLVNLLISEAGGEVESKIETPNGWHYLTRPFDTRKVCALYYVSLLRDGYFYVKTVQE